jgi:hypothetical protein
MHRAAQGLVAAQRLLTGGDRLLDPAEPPQQRGEVGEDARPESLTRKSLLRLGVV